MVSWGFYRWERGTKKRKKEKREEKMMKKKMKKGRELKLLIWANAVSPSHLTYSSMHAPSLFTFMES